MEDIAIIGAGGHTLVIIDIINETKKYNIIGLYDDVKTGIFYGHKILGKIKDINKNTKNYIIGIGNNNVRKKIFEQYKDLNWCKLIHPKAIISNTANIKSGTVICAGAIVQPYVEIGSHCIINTNSNIDHQSNISNFVSVCPGVTICGNVNIGTLSFIGANSTIIQNLNIGSNTIIGAGSVIIKAVDCNKKIVGNPGKYI